MTKKEKEPLWFLEYKKDSLKERLEKIQKLDREVQTQYTKAIKDYNIAVMMKNLHEENREKVKNETKNI